MFFTSIKARVLAIILSMGLVSIVGFGQLSILDDRHYLVMFCFMLNIILAALLAALLFKRILHPIRQLMKMADDFKDGVLDERLEFNKKDELGALGCHFIEMTEDVEALNKNLLERDALNHAYGSAVAILSASNDREMALSEVLALISMHLPVFAGTVCLHSPEGGKELFLTAVHGMDDDAVTQKSFLEYVSKELDSLGHMMSLKYLSDAEFLLEGETSATQPEYAVMFPMLYRQEKLGVLMLALHHELSQPQLDFLQKLVGDMAIAMKDISRYEQLEMLNCELEKSRKQLQQERDDAVEDSITDGLTRIYNRGYFDLSGNGLLKNSRRNGQPLALLLIDIDFFKNVNDTFGHPCGDVVLIRVAEMMKNSLRETDFVARYGGEEFVCVLTDADMKQAEISAEKLRLVIAAETFSQMGDKSVTVSIGLSALRDDDKELQPMVERADKALYHAKETGRNRVVCDTELDKLS